MFKDTGYRFGYLFLPFMAKKRILNQASFAVFDHHAETPGISRLSPVVYLEERHLETSSEMKAMLKAKAKMRIT